MKKSILKVISLALVVMTVFLTCTCAFASNDEREEPTRYNIINTATLTFTISGVTAKGAASLSTQRNTSMQIVMTLQKQNASGTWSNVKTWSTSGTGNHLNLAGSRVINILNTYRMKATFTAGGETATIYRY